MKDTFKAVKTSIDKEIQLKHPSENPETQIQALKEKYIGLGKKLLDEIINGTDNSNYIKDFTQIIETKTALKNCNTNTENNFLNDIERAFEKNCMIISKEYNCDAKKISVNSYFYYL